MCMPFFTRTVVFLPCSSVRVTPDYSEVVPFIGIGTVLVQYIQKV